MLQQVLALDGFLLETVLRLINLKIGFIHFF